MIYIIAPEKEADKVRKLLLAANFDMLEVCFMDFAPMQKPMTHIDDMPVQKKRGPKPKKKIFDTSLISYNLQ